MLINGKSSVYEDEDEDEESVIHDGMTQGAGASETMPTPVHTELDLYNAFSTTTNIVMIIIMNKIITNPSMISFILNRPMQNNKMDLLLLPC